MIKNALQLNLV